MELLVGLVWITALGLTAGALTTVSGMGGGLVLVFVLSLVIGPKAALLVSSAALLVGNVHRTWLYRASIDTGVVRRLLLGLVPGTFAGAWLAAGLPDNAIRVIMLVAALVTLGRAVTSARWRLPASSLTPAAAVVGFLAATAGGAAVLLGPIMLSSGLTGRRYLAVTAVGASAMHVVRLSGYGLAGMWSASYLPLVAGLAAAILVGNLIGRRLRDVVSEKAGNALEVATPVVCAALAIAGIG
ncbi:MAG: sulfite exporter TauE/SafE family protein [Deltaproteobacteria bacterium]|nr:sulfite exporter TauE/SafE family protein [Kofleriaceae bacterium]